MTDFSTVERSIVIQAEPGVILPWISDFTKWPAWSPWEQPGADLKRTYEGAPGSQGASYSWDGKGRAGAGTMRATTVSARDVGVALAFTRPFKSQSDVHFALSTPAEGSTKVSWTMKSPKTTMSRIMGVVMNMDKMIGGDFDKGLASLKALVEK